MAGLSDRQLLERFNVRRDAGSEAAFAALVARHGPMVHAVCRQLLDDGHLADDAFQATFLVLARKARSIRDPDRLGNWLYGVAFRTARCAGLRLARRRKREEVGTMNCSGSNVLGALTVPSAIEAIIAGEQARALHCEIERLPDVFRVPVVLCYLEGLTVHEVAQRLRWSHGTVRSRMARARQAPPWPHPPRHRASRCRAGCGTRLLARLGVRFSGGWRSHDPGRAAVRCRRRRR